MVSLIEHKTNVDYNVCMQTFRYIVYIWEAYEKEMEQIQSGISKLKDFKYPPVLPIVYYEGSKRWTAPLDLKSRINHSEAFVKYIPDFQYYLVPVHDYTNEELLEKSDEISLVMLFNKIQTKEDVEEFRKISPQRMEEILKETPPHLLNIMANVLLAFLLKENVPVEEAENLVGKVKEKKMAELFANMEHMDIQAERRNTEEQRQRADKAEERADKAEERADKAEERADKAEERADKAEERADRAEERADKAEEQTNKVAQELEEEKRKNSEFVKLYIENCQEFCMLEEGVVERLVEKFGLDVQGAQEMLRLYWK